MEKATLIDLIEIHEPEETAYHMHGVTESLYCDLLNAQHRLEPVELKGLEPNNQKWFYLLSDDTKTILLQNQAKRLEQYKAHDSRMQKTHAIST